MEIISWTGKGYKRPLVRSDEGCFLLNISGSDQKFSNDEIEMELERASLIKRLKDENSCHTYYCSSNLLIVIHQKTRWLGFNFTQAWAFPLRKIIELDWECRECLSCSTPGQPCFQKRRPRLKPAI